MFTGIISSIGLVQKKSGSDNSCTFRIASAYPASGILLGASIACSGVCLTVTGTGVSAEERADWFEVDISAETLSRTNLGEWQEGSRINLERALRVGDELGGHIVSGHVDGIAVLEDVRPEGNSLRLTFTPPAELSKFIAEKGSVTLDGVSLTVNEVETARFGVNIIPHTQAVTTLGQARKGQRLNLEIDVLARYVERLKHFP